MSIEGARFGRLVFVRQHSRGEHSKWWMRCDCGVEKAIYSNDVRKGRTKSCGCLNKEMPPERRVTHAHTLGGQRSAEYKSWQSLRDRCLNKANAAYARYGGRGITVDPRWDSFENFLEDMGRRPSSGYSIERKNNNEGYSKTNCMWATAQEQGNNKRNNRLLTHAGRTQTSSKWARELGMKPSILAGRLYLGWSVERALTTPVRTK